MARASYRLEAYPGEPLSSHLALTALVAEALYAERWRFLAATLGASLEPLMPLSALLHDVGKPLVPWRRSYTCHEYIGANLLLVLARRARRRLAGEAALLVKLAAVPTMLHHHGMEPQRQLRCRGSGETTSDALAATAAELRRAAQLYLRCGGRSEEAARLAERVAEALEALAAEGRRYRLPLAPPKSISVSELDVYSLSRLSSVLTGFVSVADAVAGGAARAGRLDARRYYARVLAELAGHREDELSRLWGRVLGLRSCTHG